MSAIVRMTKALQLRSELAMLRARYDHGQVSPAVYRVIKDLEVSIAWREHYATYEETQV
jgi:hypothetical protein